jgi:hypothetical protein
MTACFAGHGDCFSPGSCAAVACQIDGTEPGVTAVEQVTEPGIYAGMPEVVYHADPALSASGAKRLLPPSCPALFRWWADHPQPHKPAFDLGHAAHQLVLGAGPTLRSFPYDDWRTKAAREARDEAYAEGVVPLLEADYQRVIDMAAVIAEHPVASALFDPDHGRPEVSLFARAGLDGPMLRGRLDWLPEHRGGRLIVPDYKTCRSAEPEAFARACADLGYHQQAAWYLDLVTALDLAGDERPAFVFVAQEKEPPYLVTVAEPDPVALRWARDRNEQAIDLFAACTASGEWPGYANDVVSLPLPAWVERRYLEESA